MSFQQRFPIFVRAINNLRHERTFLLLIALLVVVVIGLSLLLLTMIVIFNPQYLMRDGIRIGVYDDHPSYFWLDQERTITVLRFSDEFSALDAFSQGDIDAVIYVQQEHTSLDPAILHVIIPESPIQQSLLLSIIKTPFSYADSQLQYERGILDNAVWHHQVRTSERVHGANTLFELFIGIIIPLLIIIPAFLIGNLFVDMMSQEQDEGGLQLIFVATSPLRYVYEHWLMGMAINIAFVGFMLWVISARYSFIQGIGWIFVYSLVLCSAVIFFSLLCSFLFPKKEVAQLVYSLGIIIIFVLSPLLPFTPTASISAFLLGDTIGGFVGLCILSGVAIMSYLAIRYTVNKMYYC